MDTNELEARVAAVGPPTPEQMWRELRQLSANVDRLLKAVTKDPLVPGAPDGLVQLQEAHGRHLGDLETRVTDLEEQRDHAAEKWGGRAWGTFYDIAKLAAAAGLGAWFSKGGPH